MWDIETGNQLLNIDSGTGSVSGIAWSPDGTRIIVGGRDNTAYVLPAWQSAEELTEYAHECCLTRELTCQERETYGIKRLCH